MPVGAKRVNSSSGNNWGASHVKLTDGKRPDSLLPLRHGVDLPLRRFAPSFRAKLQRGRLPAPHKNLARRLRGVHHANHGADHDLQVEYGHLLIGLSLLTGLMVRVSASFGVVLMIIYWFAHMDWPFIENTNNFIVDYHLVYGGVLVYLIIKRAGHVFGFDGWVENFELFKRHPSLKPLVA